MDIEQKLERILREARVLAIAEHPNILRYFNSWFEITYFKNSSDICPSKTKIKCDKSEFNIFALDDNGN